MELKDIYGLWDRFDQSGAAEMELDFYGVHFKLKAPAENDPSIPAIAKVHSAQLAENDPSIPVIAKVHSAQPAENEPSIPAIERVHSAAVASQKAPLVGVFYRSPAPGKEPFITVGMHVKKGEVIGIIEAMKCMNEITAICDLTVEEILAEDGMMVEYDQALFTYLPD